MFNNIIIIKREGNAEKLSKCEEEPVVELSLLQTHHDLIFSVIR